MREAEIFLQNLTDHLLPFLWQAGSQDIFAKTCKSHHKNRPTQLLLFLYFILFISCSKSNFLETFALQYCIFKSLEKIPKNLHLFSQGANFANK
jgi:hypothetical protein